MARFAESCELVPYLRAAMAGPYREPRRRPPDLEARLRAFLALRDVGPGLA